MLALPLNVDGWNKLTPSEAKQNLIQMSRLTTHYFSTLAHDQHSCIQPERIFILEKLRYSQSILNQLAFKQTSPFTLFELDPKHKKAKAALSNLTTPSWGDSSAAIFDAKERIRAF